MALGLPSLSRVSASRASSSTSTLIVSLSLCVYRKMTDLSAATSDYTAKQVSSCLVVIRDLTHHLAFSELSMHYSTSDWPSVL